MRKTYIFILLMLSVAMLVGCGRKRTPEERGKDVVKDMNLPFDSTNITSVKEIYYNYSGAPWEGIAFYEMELDDTAAEEALKWESLPLSKEAKELVESVVMYVTVPEIEEGTYMFYDVHPDEESSINERLVIYDSKNKLLYYLTVDS